MAKSKFEALNPEWIQLCQIHRLTKHYTLLAEETGIKLQAFLQPIKEQRDAYEHIARAYSKLLLDQMTEKTISADSFEYAKKNLDKAIGHEFRAFYDTIDFLTILLRKDIYDAISTYKYEQIISVYPDYKQLKSALYEIPQQIAKFREEKDIGNSDRIQAAEQYAKIVNQLYEINKYIQTEVVAKLSVKAPQKKTSED